VSWIGGRKTTLVLIAMALVATRNLLGLDANDVQMIVYLALGGSGAIAIEDATTKISLKRKAPAR